MCDHKEEINNTSVYQLWKKSKEENMSREQFKCLLVENGLIVLKEKALADKWIKEMKEMGLTPDQMLEVIQLARENYKLLNQ